MLNIIKQLIKDEEGVSAIEYGLIAALVAIGIITALTTLGDDLTKTFTHVSTKLQGAIGS